MPFRKKKPKLQKRHSFFSDQVIQEHSIASCPCELYFPEPSLTFDEFGAVKDVCLSGDLTLVWSKYCVVHLCKITDIPVDFTFTLEDTGQENEVCFSVVLNRNKGGDYSYVLRDEHWHEYSHKVGTSWRRFVLEFDAQDKHKFDEYELTIKNILQEVNNNKIEDIASTTTYLLIAVQSEAEKRKSNLSGNRHSRRSLYDLKQIDIPNSDSESDTSDTENVSPDEDTSNKQQNISLVPPFEPAPFIPFGLDAPPDTGGKISNQSTPDAVSRKIDLLCDSLHIHPNELPQTLESILRSVSLSETIRSREVTPLREDRKSAEKDTEKNSTYVAGKNYDVSERFNSENLVSDEIYVPMGLISRQSSETVENTASLKMSLNSASQAEVKKVQEVAHGLEAAINHGDVVKAQNFAKELTLHGVTCRVTDVKLKDKSATDKENEFGLKVNIEDKESSGSSITLKVRSTDTIRDLKNRMLIKHMFPVEVQYWIIGKRIPSDSETLERCRIKTHGYTAFLYLVSAKSAGIDKEEFMKKQALLKNPDYVAGAMAALTSPEGGQTLGRQSSKGTPGSATPGLPSGASGGSSIDGKSGKKPKFSMANINDKKNEKPALEKIHQQQVPMARVQPKVEVLQQSGYEIAHNLSNLADDFSAMSTHSDIPLGQSRQRVAVMHPQEDEETQQGWACPKCTYMNQPTRPGCEVCTTPRPDDYEVPADYVITDEEKKRLEMEALIERQTREAQERERLAHAAELEENYAYLQRTDNVGVITNTEQFACPICFEDIPAGEGVVLRECLHTFCRDCLSDAVKYNEEPVLKCPFVDQDYACDGLLQDREVKGLVSQQAFAKYLARSLATAESQAQNSFHCKTADCPGWCIYEDHVNFFVCQVCGKENCLTCKAIHAGMNCKQYQEDLKLRAVNDKTANQTQVMIRKMLDDGDAMKCPQCQVIVMKKEGCDWIQCSICKTEICWVTKGRRWGPLGNGDISGGCRCRVDGDMCHPDCNNCH